MKKTTTQLQDRIDALEDRVVTLERGLRALKDIGNPVTRRFIVDLLLDAKLPEVTESQNPSGDPDSAGIPEMPTDPLNPKILPKQKRPAPKPAPVLPDDWFRKLVPSQPRPYLPPPGYAPYRDHPLPTVPSYPQVWCSRGEVDDPKSPFVAMLLNSIRNQSTEPEQH